MRWLVLGKDTQIMQKRQGFTLLELLIVVVILGVLALIAAPSLLNAADRAKEGTVKANVSAAASTVTSKLALELTATHVASDVATDVIDDLNANGDNKNPIDDTIDAFTNAPAAGAVVVTAPDDDTITITGYGKDGATALITKTINAPESN